MMYTNDVYGVEKRKAIEEAHELRSKNRSCDFLQFPRKLKC